MIKKEILARIEQAKTSNELSLRNIFTTKEIIQNSLTAEGIISKIITEKIWNEIFKLKNLEHLDLSYLLLNSIPIQISELKNLTTLDVSDNKLNTIPVEIIELKNLTNLNISKNNLNTIPKEIFNIKNVYFDDNRLKDTLSFDFGFDTKNNNKLKKLKENDHLLYLNIYEKISKKIISKSTHTLIEDVDNYAIIVKVPLSYVENISYKTITFYINIFGKKETQSYLLTKIREAFKNLFIENEIFYYSFFNYNTKDSLIKVDYDRLIKLNKYGKNMYLDENTGKSFPINDLFRYIQGSVPERKKDTIFLYPNK